MCDKLLNVLLEWFLIYNIIKCVYYVVYDLNIISYYYYYFFNCLFMEIGWVVNVYRSLFIFFVKFFMDVNN